jgi:hypothetical protein
MGEYNPILKLSQAKISDAKIVHAKLVNKVYARILALFRESGLSACQRHEVQFPWCTDAGLCSFRLSQGPVHVCILKNIEGLLLLPLIGYDTLAIEVILNSR